jgi:hypothetical protein
MNAPELDPNGDHTVAPGEITDRTAYETAKAEGRIEEIPPGDPRATALPTHTKADPAGGEG